jgi:hypothetical protein
MPLAASSWKNRCSGSTTTRNTGGSGRLAMRPRLASLEAADSQNLRHPIFFSSGRRRPACAVARHGRYAQAAVPRDTGHRGTT